MMHQPCPICGKRMYSLTCKTCKKTWESERAFYLYGYRTYRAAAMKFLTDEKTAANLMDAIELFHKAWRYLDCAEKAEKNG